MGVAWTGMQQRCGVIWIFASGEQLGVVLWGEMLRMRATGGEPVCEVGAVIVAETDVAGGSTCG